MPEDRSDKVLFREIQRFRQVWLWAMVLAWPAIMTGVLGYALFRQTVLGQPVGSSPVSNKALALVASAQRWSFWVSPGCCMSSD